MSRLQVYVVNFGRLLRDWFVGDRQGACLTVGILAALLIFEVTLSGVAAVFPLILISLAAFGSSRVPVWVHTLVLIVFTFSLYAIKYELVLAPRDEVFFSYRFHNRLLAAAVLLLTGLAITAWRCWQVERLFFDNVYRRKADEDVQVTALICGALLAILIAVVDFSSPANINWAVFYAMALFLIGWTRVPTLIFSSAAILVVLTALGCSLGPPPSIDGTLGVILCNRAAVSASLVTIALLQSSRAACSTKF